MSQTGNGASLPRYSVYFVPEDTSELAAFGRRVLQAEPAQNDHPARIAITRKAAHYGFHSTLKAPMELAQGIDQGDLLRFVEDFVKMKKPMPLCGIGPNVHKGFHALTLPDSSTATPAIDEFAADVVRAFDRFRAPLTDADRSRRNPAKLSERQRQNLELYGYPHVIEDFFFHMTLSHRMEHAAESASYHDWLSDLYTKTVTRTPALDRLAVFWQPDRSTAFTRLAEFPLS